MDKAHKTDSQVGYLSYNKADKFVFIPKLYEGDNAEIGHEKALYHAIYDQHNDIGIFSN